MSSDFINSVFKVAVIDDLSVPKVKFLLGHDLAGGDLKAILIIKENPLDATPTAELNMEQHNVFLMCDITRSHPASRVKDQDENVENSPNPVNDSLINEIISRAELCKCQQSDHSLAAMGHAAEDKKVKGKSPSFYNSQGVVMRSYRPPGKTDNDVWATVHQIVFPSSAKTPFMELAHNISTRHFGQKNTNRKLLNHFFWPGMKDVVADFARSCLVCQLVG